MERHGLQRGRGANFPSNQIAYRPLTHWRVSHPRSGPQHDDNAAQKRIGFAAAKPSLPEAARRAGSPGVVGCVAAEGPLFGGGCRAVARSNDFFSCFDFQIYSVFFSNIATRFTGDFIFF